MSNEILHIERRRLEMNLENHLEEVLEDHVYLEVVVAINLNEEVIMSKKVNQGRIEVDLQSWMIAVKGKMILISYIKKLNQSIQEQLSSKRTII